MRCGEDRHAQPRAHRDRAAGKERHGPAHDVLRGRGEKEDEYGTDTSSVNEKQLNLAKMLIEALAAEFEPQKYHDTYRTNLQQNGSGQG